MYKISVVLFLAAAVFSPHRACSQEKRREYPVSFGTSVSAGHGTHGTEVPKQSQASAVRYRPTENLSAALAGRAGQPESSAEGYRSTEEPPDKIGQIINQTVSLMQRSGMVNSSTCGRPWKIPLSKIQGKIRNVEYREQPFTGRTGLHIDVA
ncbi:MAG: hypothetical protein D3906_14350, partial [Candidatus Electrothrix sp. AUS1_2]|nr:hypothetical protein [Candidatus Electrothrix sp. AUS1_2]